MGHARFIAIATLFVSSVSLAWGQARPSEDLRDVTYFEIVEDLSVEDHNPLTTKDSSSRLVSFFAFGERFVLEIESSRIYAPGSVVSLITPNGIEETEPDSIHYKGSWSGHNDSWVRLTIRGNDLSGMIRTENEIYFLSTVGKGNEQPLPDLIMYRLSDVLLGFADHAQRH